MLSLKPYLAARPPPQPASFTGLPSEIIELILELAYIDGGQRREALLPVSLASRRLRGLALSILCREVLCVLRGDEDDSPHPPHDLNIDHLLHFGKTLCVRTVLDDGPRSQHQAEAIRSQSMRVLQYHISRMPQLQLVRVQCLLFSAIDLLSILKDRPDVTVHLIFVSAHPDYGDNAESVSRFRQLLEGRTIAVGPIQSFIYTPHHLPISPPSLKSLQAIHLEVYQAPGRLIPGLNCDPFPSAFSALEELWLDMSVQDVGSMPLGSAGCFFSLYSLVSLSKLERLHLSGASMRMLFDLLLTNIPSLRHLRLSGECYWAFLYFHHNCPSTSATRSPWAEEPLFQIYFKAIPHLRSLSIEGMCSHVPIENVVSPSLCSLNLHRPYLISPSGEVGGASGQRTPTELIKIARTAPMIESLGLDIGSIKNLWHPTAIPGVNVDPMLYSFLAALSHFHHLRTLRLFPSHVGLDSGGRLTTGDDAPLVQLCSDQQVIRIFNHLRQQNPKLSVLIISPGLRENARLKQLPIARTWEVQTWGEKTLLVTRQMGNDYELREIWVGERKLSSEVKRDGYQKGCKLGYRRQRDDEWLLERSPRI